MRSLSVVHLKVAGPCEITTRNIAVNAPPVWHRLVPRAVFAVYLPFIRGLGHNDVTEEARKRPCAVRDLDPRYRTR